MVDDTNRNGHTEKGCDAFGGAGEEAFLPQANGHTCENSSRMHCDGLKLRMTVRELFYQADKGQFALTVAACIRLERIHVSVIIRIVR